MRAPRFALALLTLAAGLHIFSSPSDGGAAYRGTVVDAETKAPLEGAAVVVLWHKKPMITMDGPKYLHKAVEVLTDAKGQFSVDASPGIDWNPFTYVVQEPQLTIFKPGYGPFPRARVSPKSIREIEEALLSQGAVVELSRLKTTEELRRFTGPGDILLGIDRYERIPNLMRLINTQRKRLGLRPYPGDFERGPSR
jgi:hypothetical protein